MIYVYRDASKVPQEWKDKASALLAELEKCTTPKERNDVIDTHHLQNDRRTLWSELKKVLLEMSHGKCWYSEARDDVSDWHVDHFRPKKRALDDDGTRHEGYHWLAFDWRNFRIAGSMSNVPHTDASGETRGKWDYFPLMPGAVRARWEQRETDNERPLILDPTRRGDAGCMMFDEEGIPKPVNESPLVQLRVERTSYYLFLDEPRLVDGRKQRWRECEKWIRELHELIPMEIEMIDAARFAQIARIEENIREMTRPEQPYSSMIRSCLKLRGMDYLIETPEGYEAAA